MKNIILGILFVLVGLAFVAIPFDKLTKVFPKMRSKGFVVACGIVILLCGALLLILSFIA